MKKLLLLSVFIWSCASLSSAFSASDPVADESFRVSYLVSISDANTLALELSIEEVIQITCSDSNDGQISATATGGVPPYQYTINGQSTSDSGVFSNLTAGSYVIQVTDATGTSVGTNPIELIAPAAIQIDMMGMDANCEQKDGHIYLDVTGGTAPFSFDWNIDEFDGQEDLRYILAGTYTVVVEDANGCTATRTIIIQDLAGQTIDATIISSTCGENNGSINLTLEGGTAPFYFDWDDNSLDGIQNPEGLASGNYSITVIDSNGCTADADIALTNIAGPTINPIAQNANCGQSDGAIQLSLIGGTAPFQFDWNNDAFDGQDNIENLPPGNYSVMVTDANGCSASSDILIEDTPGPVLFVFASESEICLGESLQLTGAVNGGAGVLNFSWGNPINANGASQIVTPASAGSFSYSVTLTDENGCSDTGTLNIIVHENIIVSAGTDQSICPGESVSLAANLQEGTANSYLWTNLTTGETHQGESWDVAPTQSTTTYSVQVSSPDGCTRSDEVSVIADPTLCPSDISVQKEFVNTVLQADGTYLLNYNLHVRNIGGNGTYDLIDQTGFDDDILIHSASYSSNVFGNTESLTLDNSGYWNLVSQQSISSNTVHTYHLAINVSYLIGDGIGDDNYSYCNNTPGSGIFNQAFIDTDHDMQPDDSAFVCADLYLIDLSLSKTASNTSPLVGESIHFLLTLSNDEPRSATGISVNEILPDGFTYLNSTASAGTYNSNTGIWYIGLLNSNDEHTLQIEVRVNSDGDYCNQAYVDHANETDLDSRPGPIATFEDDEAIACVQPSCSLFADISITHCENQGTATEADDQYYFSIQVDNFHNAGSTSTWAGSIDDHSISGEYGQVVEFGPYPLNNFQVSIQDATAPNNCNTLTQIITPDFSCSSDCDIPPSVPLSMGDQAICADETAFPELSVIVNTNETIDWYDTPSGGIPIVSGTNNFTPTVPGTYYAQSRNQLTNCTNTNRTPVTFTILPVSELVLQGVETICNSNAIEVSVEGYDLASWSNLNEPSPATFISNPGMYEVTVLDENNCSLSATFEVSAIDLNIQILSSSSPTNCEDNDGLIDFTINDGDDYWYSIDGGDTWLNNGLFSDLNAGEYNLMLASSNQECIISLPELLELEAAVPPVLESVYAIQPSACLPASGSIEFVPDQEELNYSYSIDGGATWYSNPIFSNLVDGTYELAVQLANGGCSTVAGTSVITTPASLEIELLDAISPTCYDSDDGKATVSAFGGTPPYAYLWSNEAITSSLTDLLPGLYSIEVTDANNCSSNLEITIAPSPATQIVLHGDADTTLCANQSLHFAVQGDYQEIYWQDTEGNTVAEGEEITISSSGTFEVFATHETGCLLSDEIEVLFVAEEFEADFTIPKQGVIGFPSSMVEISSVKPQAIRWVYDTTAFNLYLTLENKLSLIPTKVGVHTIGLWATNGSCSDYIEYEIEIVESQEELTYPGSFNTDFATIKEFTISPNPNDGKFRVDILLSAIEEVNIHLLDNNGNIVNQQTLQGDHNYRKEFDISHLPGGVYVVVIETEMQLLFEGMVLIK